MVRARLSYVREQRWSGLNQIQEVQGVRNVSDVEIGRSLNSLLKGGALVLQTNGGVPPFGHSTQLRVFVDPGLLQYDEVWAAAGTGNDNFGAAPADTVRVAGGVVTDLKRG